uniref:Uncharacterized protein n=1 Tax=Anguilla anguilla TaxID=7936 RepID=A0A0E9U0B1_ANGAN
MKRLHCKKREGMRSRQNGRTGENEAIYSTVAIFQRGLH